jgi:hypothetical protein
VSWIKEARDRVLAAILVGLFVVANVAAGFALLMDPCGDVRTPLVWAVVAAVVSGVALFVICARVAPHAWIGIAAGVATTVVSAIALVAIVLLQESELCAA